MSEDLVKELRVSLLDEYSKNPEQSVHQVLTIADEERAEAADALEAKDAEIAKLRQDHETFRKEMERELKEKVEWERIRVRRLEEERANERNVALHNREVCQEILEKHMRRARAAEAEVERLREALRFIQDMPYKSGPDNHLGRASDIAKQALSDQQSRERESDAVSSTVYGSAVEGRRSFRTLYRQARDALKETRRQLRKNRLSWNGPQFQAVWTINTALNEQPPEDQPGGISPAQPDPRDAVVEAAHWLINCLDTPPTKDIYDTETGKWEPGCATSVSDWSWNEWHKRKNEAIEGLRGALRRCVALDGEEAK